MRHGRTSRSWQPAFRYELDLLSRDRMLRTRETIIGLLGALMGAFPFALMGSHSGHEAIGAAVGAAVGGFVSLAAYRGWIGVLTTGGIVGAVLFALMGPSVDDYTGISSVPGFFLGMVTAWVVRAIVRGIRRLGLRSAYFVPAVVTGVMAAATREPFWLILFLIVSAPLLNWDVEHQTTPCSPCRRERHEPGLSSGATDSAGQQNQTDLSR